MKKREYRGNKKKRGTGHQSEASSEFLINQKEIEIKKDSKKK